MLDFEEKGVAVFRHILVATDFSLPSLTALSAARGLLQRVDAQLTLMHVHPPGGDPALTREALEELREERLGGFERVELVNAQHPQPDVAICGHAMVAHADLIIAGRHGEHGMAERLLGTTTERVVRHAPCSVLVEHPARHESFLSLRHILAGSDFSASAEPPVDVAGALGRTFEAWVTLMHVYDLVPPLKVLEQPYEPEQDRSWTARCRAELEKIRERRLEGVPAGVEVLRDKSVVTAMCDWAGDREVDLMIVGSHGRTGLARMLLGSVAERVVRHAPCSVMVVRNGRS